MNTWRMRKHPESKNFTESGLKI